MPSQPPLPPLLVPYVSSLPQSSLTLISSVVAATGNWLVLRYLYAALNTSSSSNATFGVDDAETGKKRKVVLVSFVRSWDFWKSEAKRLGLDLARLSDKGQFAFVDGLSELFYSPPKAPTPSPSQAGAVPPRGLPIRPQPGAVPARSPQPIPESGNNSLYKPSTVTNVTQLHFSGNGTTALDGLEKDIATVIEKLNSTKGNGEDESEVVLIIDQPDLLLAATGPSRGIGATEMMEWVMGLQQHVHSTILTLSADSPLIHNVSDSAQKQATPLEIEHAAFAIGSAHRARTIMQLRNLETGAASDVSGVLRASKGGAWEGGQSKGQEGSWEEREVLYFIQRDGGVSVFGRGES